MKNHFTRYATIAVAADEALTALTGLTGMPKSARLTGVICNDAASSLLEIFAGASDTLIISAGNGTTEYTPVTARGGIPVDILTISTAGSTSNAFLVVEWDEF